ncbi:MAG: hypothetical protein AAGF84_09680 [Planctomycetota bacterium]
MRQILPVMWIVSLLVGGVAVCAVGEETTPYLESLIEAAAKMGVLEEKLEEARAKTRELQDSVRKDLTNEDAARDPDAAVESDGDASDVGSMIMDLLYADPEAVEQRNAAALAARYDAYERIALSDDDRRGVAALLGSRFAEARAAFEASHAEAKADGDQMAAAFPASGPGCRPWSRALTRTPRRGSPRPSVSTMRVRPLRCCAASRRTSRRCRPTEAMIWAWRSWTRGS